MSEAIGIRFDDGFLKKIDKISRKEVLDRSNTIRKLVYLGYSDLIKKIAAEEYKKGKITISEAAFQAEVSLWDMEKYLVEEGYLSSYSIDDFESEMESLKKIRK